MGNIFNIQEDLINIFNQIEENEGELTPELEEALSIKEGELKDKVESYTKVISSLESDLQAIAEEKKRLDALKKSKEKTIEKLKSIIVYAIDHFGSVAKNGGKYIVWSTGKATIRKSQSLEIDENCTTNFVNKFIQMFRWMNQLNQFDVADTDMEQVLHYCNGVADENNENTVQLKDTDLDALNADITITANMADLIKSEEGKTLIRKLVEFTSSVNIKPNINKTVLKSNIKEGIVNPVFAKLVTKESVIIK